MHGAKPSSVFWARRIRMKIRAHKEQHETVEAILKATILLPSGRDIP